MLLERFTKETLILLIREYDESWKHNGIPVYRSIDEYFYRDFDYMKCNISEEYCLMLEAIFIRFPEELIKCSNMLLMSTYQIENLLQTYEHTNKNEMVYHKWTNDNPCNATINHSCSVTEYDDYIEIECSCKDMDSDLPYIYILKLDSNGNIIS